MSVGSREERSRKRRKVQDSALEPASFASLDQLQRLLEFSPNTPPEEVVAGINKFQRFLGSISRNEGTTEHSRQLTVLREYCEAQSSASHDQVDFPDLLSTWSTASQANTEAVLSALPAALTQFFRTVSSHVDFREFGLSLCHSLLKRDQLRLFDRSLSSPRAKEFLITPCLQLLAEVASFDGGALASKVFSRRDFLYRRLEGILTQTPANPIRTLNVTAHQAALAFFLTNLKYLDASCKAELVTHGRLTYSAIRSLANVDTATVVRFLDSLRESILNDDSLSKHLKVRCFNSGVLSVLSNLYDYTSGPEAGPSREIRDHLQRLLLQVCTSTKGLLLAQAGWYPTGVNPDMSEQDENMIVLGLDSPFYTDDYADKVHVKNTTLSTFIQSLRPENDILQAELIIAVLEAAPELVADYFTKRQRFAVPPGDDPKWRGQFAFLFSVIQLPVPRFCGWHERLPLAPPPLSIVIESIIPRPLDRATIGKCLRMTDDLMTMSATRLLTVALEKLEAILRLFSNAPAESNLWRQACTKLTTLFVDRVPALHDIVTALQRGDQSYEQTRTMVLECIATYLRVLPSSIATSKFDFGPSLARVLQALQSERSDAETKDVLVQQVQHLLYVVNTSPPTRWFHKTATDDLSLIGQLIKYAVEQSTTVVSRQALPILKGVLEAKGILNSSTRSFDAMVTSLRTTKNWQADLSTYQFLDNCLSRTMQRPVKYLDQLERAQKLLSDSADLSLVVCCVSEQWQFLVKKDDKPGMKHVAEWVARLFTLLESAGENYRIMHHFKEDMMRQCEENDKAKATLAKAFEKQRKKPATLAGRELLEVESLDGGSALEDLTNVSQPHELNVDLNIVFPSLPPIPGSLSGLDRWSKPDFESEIQTGRLANLIRCLISPESEIRLQTFHTLQTVMHAVEESGYDEKTQLYLLLGELAETVRTRTSSDPTTPPPSIVAELAIHFLPIVAEPSSPFYRKTNNFLLRGPTWSLTHILTYWLNDTFLVEPEIDDADIPIHLPQAASSSDSIGGGGTNNAQALEIAHLLDLLARSLRTAEDMNLFRRAQVFTRLLSYYLAPVAPRSIRKKILALVYRATQIEGGSDTLITRAGVREWLRVAKTLRGHSGQGPLFGKVDGEVRGWTDALERVVERTCDGEGIRRWESERRRFKDRENGDSVTDTRKSSDFGREGTLLNRVHTDGHEEDQDADEDESSDLGSEADSDPDSDWAPDSDSD